MKNNAIGTFGDDGKIQTWEFQLKDDEDKEKSDSEDDKNSDSGNSDEDNEEKENMGSNGDDEN